MKTNFLKLAGLLITLLTIQSCMSDIRTDFVKTEGLEKGNIKKGKMLIESAWQAQGFDKLANHKVYAFSGLDTWKGMMGKTGKLWPDPVTQLEFKYRTGSFDGQVTFKDGKRQGDKVGLQNWHYYEAEPSGSPKFVKSNKRIVFGIAAYQYFTEIADRLKQAPFVTYAGKKQLRGQTYDLVYCSWHQTEKSKDYDQYIAWISPKTGLIEFLQYTIRENYLKMPGGQMFYGGVEFSDFKNIDGIKIPHTQTVYVMDLKEDNMNFLHQLSITDFAFDSFDPSILMPNQLLEPGGNFK